MLFFKKNNLAKSNVAVDALINKIEYFYNEKHYQGIKKLIDTTSISSLVVALEKINDSNLSLFFLSASNSEDLCKFFLSFTIDNQIKIIDLMSNFLLKKLIEDLNADDFVEILEYLEPEQYKRAIICATPELRGEVKKIRRFLHGQVGSVMNTTVISLNEETSVSNALAFLRHKRNELDIEQEIYVLNDNEKVVGVMNLQELFFCSNQELLVKDVMDQNQITLQAHEDIDDAINIFQKYETNSIAIVDQEEKFLGIINNKDMLPEIIEENVEDIYKLHGITVTQDSYLRSTVYEIVQSRIVWLIFLLFATTITTFIIQRFEELGKAWTTGLSSLVLVPIIPMITDMSGNCGGQSTATIIQSFAAKEISIADFRKVFFKELKVAVVIGLILCVFNFMRLVIYFSMFPIQKSGSSDRTLSFVGAGVSSVALLLIVICSKILAVSITYRVIKSGYDAAAVSMPLLTTVLDSLSALIFFGLGILIIWGLQEAKIINAAAIHNSISLNNFSSLNSSINI